MNQASSNSTMTRSTAEALKQIKKQGLLQKTGLSISLVQTDSPRPSFPLESSVSKETRPKQNVTIDKTSKPPPRSSVTDNKSVLLQARSVPITSSETRTSIGQSPQQSNPAVYQESKITCNVNKSNQPNVSTSETRAFGSQSWSNQSPTLPAENKPQGLTRSSQAISIVPENKNPSSSTRLSQNTAAYTENKIQTSRIIASGHENKSQGRLGQATSVLEPKMPVSQGRSHNQTLTFEGKVQTNHNRSSMNSPPSEMKILTNQVRTNKNFSTVHESKSSMSHHSHSLVMTESKTFNNSPKAVNRIVEVKSSNTIQRNQVMKGMPAERNSQVTVKTDSRSTVDHSSGSSAMLSDRSVNNPFRIATTLPKKVSHTTEEKSLVKVTRVSQNPAVSSENQSAVHSKTSQSLTMQSESKAVSQVVKISSVSSDPSQTPTAPIADLNDCSSSPVYAMSSNRQSKRSQPGKINLTPAYKKRCIKRISPDVSEQSGKSQINAETCNVTSDEGSPTKEHFFNLKKLTSGLTITPVVSSVAIVPNPSTSGANKKVEELSTVVVCPSCKQLSSNTTTCDACNTKFGQSTLPFPKKHRAEGLNSFVVTKNVTTSIQKKIVYQFPEMMGGQNQSFHFKQAVQGQVMIEGNPLIVTTRGAKGGRGKSKRKFVEPVCYTLSSDEEEAVPMPFDPLLDDVSHAGSQHYPIESEGSKSEHSSNSDILQDDNEEFDDPQFPGVTDINSHLEADEEEGEEVMYYDGENLEEEEECSAEDEEVEEEEEEEECSYEENLAVEQDTKSLLPTEYPLRCRSIRIGSYKVHPKLNNSFVPVQVSSDSLQFHAPVITDSNKTASITLKDQDIKYAMVHFGRCLPIMFIFTTPTFGEAVRNILNMSDRDPRYFDPTSKDEKTQKLTFLIEHITEEQKQHFRSVFPSDKKIKEMDQKTANELLVRSTPHQNLAVKLPIGHVPGISLSAESQLPFAISTPSQITATKIILPQPPKPVVNLFTYPPPPQTGGIAITSEDLACLNEGEFLNDAIIDFYLKYVFYEKLSPAQREKTHIFSSFFYPRLTHKPERARPGEDIAKTMQVRRHNQVKTWTRHVDIFSKDFIIIPVNQNVHWFLAIICYPGRVPDAPVNSSQPETKSNKSDNVTSTVEQEDNNKVIIKEISSNGEGDNSNQDENSMNSIGNSSYEVEEPPDSDEESAETPDSTTHPDVKQRKDLPCICIFDSLCGPNRWRIASTLREYLEMEWKMKKGTIKVFDRNTMQGFIMKCPQQTNYSDCGTYVLQYVESFFENPIPYFRSPMPDLTNWFSEAKISKKRQQLQELILKLQKKLKASAPSSSTRKPHLPEGVPSVLATALQTENR